MNATLAAALRAVMATEPAADDSAATGRQAVQVAAVEGDQVPPVPTGAAGEGPVVVEGPTVAEAEQAPEAPQPGAAPGAGPADSPPAAAADGGDKAPAEGQETPADDGADSGERVDEAGTADAQQQNALAAASSQQPPTPTDPAEQPPTGLTTAIDGRDDPSTGPGGDDADVTGTVLTLAEMLMDGPGNADRLGLDDEQPAPTPAPIDPGAEPPDATRDVFEGQGFFLPSIRTALDDLDSTAGIG